MTDEKEALLTAIIEDLKSRLFQEQSRSLKAETRLVQIKKLLTDAQAVFDGTVIYNPEEQLREVSH